jgi:hypothetical protein
MNQAEWDAADQSSPTEVTKMGHHLDGQCLRCQEHYVPADEQDLIHLEREDGTPCGGTGMIVGEFFIAKKSSPSS